MHKPHYWHGDLQWLFLCVPYMRLANRSCRHFLASTLSTALAYRDYLARHPGVRCRPLDLIYQCHYTLGAFDHALLDDMLFGYGWRAANWGAWLAALAPSAAYRESLALRRETLPHGTEVIDWALIGAGTDPAPAYSEQLMQLVQLRELLGEIPARTTPLRHAPNAAQAAALEQEAEQIRRCYRTQGTEAAIHLSHQGLTGYYNLSHPAWVNQGALPPPPV